MALEPEPSSPSSEPPSPEGAASIPENGTTNASMNANTNITNPNTPYLPLPDITRTRALSASRVPLPSHTPVFLTKPPENEVMVEVIRLPMPLQNNVFVVGQYPRDEAIEICGPSLANIFPEDFTVSVKGDFVETRNSSVALTLKKAYDQMFGVGKEGVKSPYVISSINGEGDQSSYRISYREQSNSSTTTSTRTASKSSAGGRLSMHHFMPSGLFGAMTTAAHHQSSEGQSNSSGSNAWTGSLRRKKLHKERSARTNGSGSRSRSGTTGSYRSNSVTDDSGTHSQNHRGDRDRVSRAPMKVYGIGGETTDLFAELLGWDPRIHSPQSSGGSGGRHTGEPHKDGDGNGHESIPRLPMHFTIQPFGEDVKFVVPSKPVRTLAETIKRELTLRPMNSFDSGLTARAGDSDLVEDDTLHARENASGYQTAIFDVLQDHTGIRQRAPGSSTDPSVGGIDPTPEDDPRFILWGTRVMSSDAASLEARLPLPPSRERMMIAASIERWVAQLTSVLDYDELLNFYLTFRTFISPVDLCRLLICRFQWSLGAGESSIDAGVRRVVRLRTFVAIKYWLQTFFVVDFLPNRDLRMLFAEWLNNAGEDPLITPDGLSILKKLRKITMDCRDHHIKKSIYSKGLTQATQSQPHLPHADGDDAPQLPPGLFGEPNPEIQDIVDLDLEKYGDVYAASSNLHKGLDLAARIAPASMQPTRTNLVDESNGSVPNAVILQQSIRMKMLSSAQNPASTASPSTVDGAIAALPKHSTLSRYFVNAFGRLERWKRDLARSRNMNPSGLGACAAGFDADAEVGGTYRGDLLTSKEGLDMYLRNMNIERGGEIAREGGAVTVEGEGKATSTSEAENGAEAGEDVLDISRESMLMASKTNPAEQAAVPNGVDEVEGLLHEEGATSSNHAGTSSAAFSSRFHPEVVSLDDYEFSDSDGSGYGVELPPGLRPVKRLPPRREFERNFELVGRESVSSLGGGSHPSAGAGAGIGGAPRHRASVSSELSAPGPGGIQAWQLQVMLDGHEDSDEEAGDVDAALRRLEGQIDANQQRHKESQVEGWLRAVERRERAVGSDYAPSETGSDTQSELATPPDDQPIVAEVAESILLSEPTLAPPPSDQGTSLVNSPAASNTALSKEREPTSPVSRPVTGNPGNRFAPAHSIRPQVHRSFILQYGSTQLAKQWCLVDRDLFLSVKFEDLTFEDQSWKQLRMYPDVTDWSLYMKERSKLKMKANVDPTVKMPSSITTSRLRFNMMVNFVASEIVLSIPQERIDVVSKFIRIAWKSYQLNNFHTVVAIMTALQTRWVLQAIGKMGSKLGIWESRLFADLQYFTSPNNDFQLVRQSVASLSPGATGKEIADDTQNTGDFSGCVPFIGMYLSQLFKHNQLPQYIDPSSPLDPVNPEATLEDLCRPEVFTDLKAIPPFLTVRPLLNVHKERLLATVIKSLVAGQHLASMVNHQVDQKLYWKCMRIKCLDPKALEQLSSRRDA